MIEKREKEEEERRRKKEEEERLASISGEDEAVEFVRRKIDAAVSPFPLRTNLAAATAAKNDDAGPESLLSPQGGGKGSIGLLDSFLRLGSLPLVLSSSLYLISSHLTSSLITLLFLISSSLTLPYLISPYLTSPHLTSPHLISPYPI